MKFLTKIFELIKRFYDHSNKIKYRRLAVTKGNPMHLIGYINLCIDQKDYVEAYVFTEVAHRRSIPHALETQLKVKKLMCSSELEKALTEVQKIETA